MCKIKSGVSVPMNMLSGYSWRMGERAEDDSDSIITSGHDSTVEKSGLKLCKSLRQFQLPHQGSYKHLVFFLIFINVYTFAS